ncbi:MAG: hypothetical protein ACUVWZ_14775, partial [Anaerolineae bacterium]
APTASSSWGRRAAPLPHPHPGGGMPRPYRILILGAACRAPTALGERDQSLVAFLEPGEGEVR